MWPYTFDELPGAMKAVIIQHLRNREFPKVGPNDPGGKWGDLYDPNAAIYWSETRPPGGGPVNDWDIFYATERYGNMIGRANYNVHKSEVVVYWYGATFEAERFPVTP
jgi:hypothetical protein